MNYWVRIQLGGNYMTQKYHGLLPLNIQLFAEDNPEGVDPLNLNIDDLFNEPDVSPTLTGTSTQTNSDPDNLTENMTKRINKVRSETEKTVKDQVAKELGFESYEAMQKTKQNDLLKQQGYDPTDLEKVIEPLIQQRLADDPRFKKLEALEAREREEYVQSQIKSINEATGQHLTVADLTPETLELWSKGLELEEAYYAKQGKVIINKVKNTNHNGSLNHLNTGTSTGATKTRRLNESEKEMYRSIVPGITEDELNKKTTPV